MSVLDLLRSFVNTPPTNPAPASSQQQNQQQQQAIAAAAPPASTNTTVPNSATPRSDGTPAAIPPASTGDQSPLANYQDLWNLGDKAANTDSVTPTLAFDQEKLLAVARNQDFTKSVDPAVLQKIQGGDHGALIALINDVGQRSFATALGMSAQVTQKALETQATNLIEKKLPEMVRNLAIQQTTRQDNPLMTNPAAAPIVQAIEQQVIAKYPQATAQEVKDHVSAIFGDIAQLVVKQSGGTIQPPRVATAGERAETDWEKFLTP